MIIFFIFWQASQLVLFFPIRHNVPSATLPPTDIMWHIRARNCIFASLFDGFRCYCCCISLLLKLPLRWSVSCYHCGSSRCCLFALSLGILVHLACVSFSFVFFIATANCNALLSTAARATSFLKPVVVFLWRKRMEMGVGVGNANANMKIT